MNSLDLLQADLPGADEVTAALDRDLTLPTALYVDPGVHRLEQQRIFARSWQYAGHVSQLANAGDRLLTRAGDVPIFVVRGKDGALRGFVNACRHRLHPVATEDGCSRLLQCPYHGWTYELDGRLRAAPRSDREADFDIASIALVPVAVDTWDQWVFVNADADAAPLAGVVDEISGYSADINRTLAGYELGERSSYDMACNWKVWAENLLECYHCPTLHKASFGKTYESSPERYAIECRTNTIWEGAPIKWLPDGADPEQLDGFRFVYLWPTSFMAVDDYVGFAGNIIPLGPERCRAFVDMYVNPDADRATTDEWLRMWDLTLEEDKHATDRQQVGFRSGAIGHGRLMAASEEPLQLFMRRTWAALAGDEG